jgi:aryl-alcohol dehydrogenase-like predicted oxidoreductase/predicted kinase
MTGRPPAIGCMRLSIDPDRDDDRSIAVLQAAFDAGVTLLDTADSYCLDDHDIGHNERLIARALASWPGNRSAITVATKGGIVRPEGRWEPDGRATHLAAACERSCESLGVRTIDLYQLHVPDPRTPFTTSVRALASLQRAGLVRDIGLCNVSVGQIEAARRIVEIAAVQVELSVWHDGGILSGVAAYCLANRLPLLAYRPLGGRKSQGRTMADATLGSIAERHGATPFEIALAWLRDLADVIVPLPGVTRIESVRSVVRAHDIRLTEDGRRALDERFPAGRLLRQGFLAPLKGAPYTGAPYTAAPDERHAPHHGEREVVLIMGLPGAGKSRLAEGFVADGYVRLNRDEAGGSLRDLAGALERELERGVTRLVLDNTYVTRRSRAAVIMAARQHGVRVRCVHLATTVDEAQVNAVWRLIERYGALPGDDELARLRKTNIAAFPPTVQFRYQRELEPPDLAEGFSAIEVVPFERRRDARFSNRAIFVWSDDGVLVEREAAMLREYQVQGTPIVVLSWQPEIAAGTRRAADVDALFHSIRERTGLSFEVAYCPHGAGAPRCWCRKPLPGLPLSFVIRNRLDPAQCVFIGEGAQDRGLARKLGFRFHDASGPAP